MKASEWRWDKGRGDSSNRTWMHAQTRRVGGDGEEDIMRKEDATWVLIRSSKTDQPKRGKEIPLDGGGNPDTCPVRLLWSWYTLRSWKGRTTCSRTKYWWEVVIVGDHNGGKGDRATGRSGRKIHGTQLADWRSHSGHEGRDGIGNEQGDWWLGVVGGTGVPSIGASQAKASKKMVF